MALSYIRSRRVGRLEVKVRQLSVPSLTTEDRDETVDDFSKAAFDLWSALAAGRLGSIDGMKLQPDGTRRRRNLVLGTLEQYPNETAAQKAVVALRADINAESPRTSLTPISVQILIDHYRQKELGRTRTKLCDLQNV